MWLEGGPSQERKEERRQRSEGQSAGPCSKAGLGDRSKRCGKTVEGLDKGRASFTFSEEHPAPGGGALRHPDGGGDGGKGWSGIRVGGGIIPYGENRVEFKLRMGTRERTEVTPSRSRARSEVY